MLTNSTRTFLSTIQKDKIGNILNYFSDKDTYIRKAAYQAIGKIYSEKINLQSKILKMLEKLLKSNNEKVRQTAVNAAGEIGMKDFEKVEHFFDKELFDEHHSVRNAVIGSVKKMGEKNPEPVLKWAKKYLHHSNAEVRREICHGIELRVGHIRKIFYRCSKNFNLINRQELKNFDSCFRTNCI